MQRSRVLIASLALVWAGGLAACGADGAEPTPSSTASSNTAAVSIPVIGGGNFDTAAFGTGPLALWFWAPG